jgi:hypothetical protein
MPRYDVRAVEDRGHYWQVLYDVTLDDGAVTGHGHSIPKITLEWRAAEYNLDPVEDFETILDIVLTEPYIASDEQVGTVPGEELYDAPDIATARARHVSRCARAKLACRLSTRKAANATAAKGDQPANPLDLIRRTAVIDPLVVEVKKEHVRRSRESMATIVLETSVDRAARIAKELNVDLAKVIGETRKRNV